MFVVTASVCETALARLSGLCICGVPATRGANWGFCIGFFSSCKSGLCRVYGAPAPRLRARAVSHHSSAGVRRVRPVRAKRPSRGSRASRSAFARGPFRISSFLKSIVCETMSEFTARCRRCRLGRRSATVRTASQHQPSTSARAKTQCSQAGPSVLRPPPPPPRLSSSSFARPLRLLLLLLLL